MGKRIFVSSNSKSLIDSLTSVLEILAEKTGTKIPFIKITSANSKSNDIQNFIENITKRITDYQVVLSSPSLGTGVDITFANDAQEIDCVFGFYEARITNHFEIDQQLARVRNPKQVDVWVSPQKFNFEPEFDVVVDDLLRGDLIGAIRYGLMWQDRAVIADQDPFLTMVALTTIKNRASKNNLKANFIKHKKQQGWRVTFRGKDDALADEGATLMELGKTRSDNEEAEKIKGARVLNQLEFEKLRRQINYHNSMITEADRYDLKRTYLERFHRTDATDGLIEKDNNGWYRRQVTLYEAMMEVASGKGKSPAELDLPVDVNLRKTFFELIGHKRIRAALLHELLSSTPIYKSGEFLLDVEYSSEDLALFAKTSLTLKRFVEGQFTIATRSDIAKKPVQHLGKVLKLLGLRQGPARNVKVKGRRFRYYKIDAVSVTTMHKIVARRSEIAEWKYLDERYGFEYSHEEMDELIGYG